MRGLANPLIFYRETSKTALLCTRQQGGVRALKSPNRTVPHPLAGRESVSLRETLPYPQIGFAAHCGLRPAVDQLFCQINARPTPLCAGPLPGTFTLEPNQKAPESFDFSNLSGAFELFFDHSSSIEAGHFLLFLVFLRCGFTLLFPRILPVLPLWRVP